jgi:hypothetical protein
MVKLLYGGNIFMKNLNGNSLKVSCPDFDAKYNFFEMVVYGIIFYKKCR